MSEPILTVDGLVVRFPGKRGRQTEIIHGVSFDLFAGKTLSLVGESGSGKTTIARAILGLAPVSEGEVCYQGKPISNLSRRERRGIAQDIQVVFQNPYGSLNPAMKVGDILSEPLSVAGVTESRDRIAELLTSVGLPTDAMDRYPREFSGGQRQRIAIARALALNPSVIICDEPTSALDVTTQAKVLGLLKEIQQRTNVSYLFISHDLGVVNAISDRTAVLYKGRIVELGAAKQIAEHPRDPYTKKLQMAAPIANPKLQRQRREERLRYLAELKHDMKEVNDDYQ
ncbi:ATP-binding cassette domain-containing protein [Bifidobacterium sp. SO4]|uniref:ATP-binding cassette domain-containing protein n=1 Tax=Bifidobacterium sp. SO4 TaxID=2809030 RepID=UPI001BDCCFBC|nr:ATP-binding cassette domain-containing protein [Bifidobacterium sp. SO4]MBT1170617.1 ABC transporter ATP-binding protein [Bifidobacterium sp. SO4]